MKFFKLAAAASVAIMSTAMAAQAEEAVNLAVGTTVFGPQGGEVGTIEQVVDGNIVVNTGTNSAPLPAASFVQGEKGPMIGFTQAQLNEAIEAAKAQADAALASALVSGAALRSIDGVALGTVGEIEGDNVTVNLDTGPIVLPKSQFATDADGLIVRFTAEQLQAALSQAAG